jgi:cytochrome c
MRAMDLAMLHHHMQEAPPSQITPIPVEWSGCLRWASAVPLSGILLLGRETPLRTSPIIPLYPIDKSPLVRLCLYGNGHRPAAALEITGVKMDSFTFNKIAGAVLSGLLLMVALRTGIEMFYPKGDANISKGMIVVTSAPVPAAAPAAAPAATEQQDPPVSTLLASATPSAGETAMKQCATCHTWTKGGGNKLGPNLYDVVGRDIGKEPGFSYSAAVAGKGGKWTFQDLYEWIKNPKGFIPGNKMAFGGVKDPKERANIIAYLDQQAGKPVPLPQK